MVSTQCMVMIKSIVLTFLCFYIPHLNARIKILEKCETRLHERIRKLEIF